LQGKTFLFSRLEGGEVPLAFTKEEKTKMIERYEDWVARSQAIFMLEFSKASIKDVEPVRKKAREAGGEMHVVKNTLFGLVLDKLGMDGKDYLEKSTLIGFAFNDAPGMAKVVTEAAKTDFFTIKGGFLGNRVINNNEIKALADLPPLPVVRAQLLGLLNAPASKLVRTINEPARGLAAVIKAYSEKDQAAAAAE